MSTGDLFTELEGEHLGIIDRLKDIYKNNKGQTIAPRKVEQMFENVPDIKRTFLVGDARDYNVLLIIPNYDDPVIQKIKSQDSLRDYYHHIVTNANRDLPPYERIINFGVLSRDFDINKEELTPKGSYRRKIIEKNFNESINQLYRSNNVEFSFVDYTILIPRWFFRDLGILEDQIVLREDGLYNPNNSKYLRISKTDKPDHIMIGDLIYQIENTVIDLGILVRQPRLWLGNKNLLEFHPCKIGWDTRLSPYNNNVYLPGKDVRPIYEAVELKKQYNIGQELELSNKLIISALNGSKEAAKESVEQLGALLKTTDERLGNVIRRRLESLATHDEFEIRSLAYMILLIDEPTPNYEEVLPAFIESGLPFLDKNSISIIATSSMNRRRLETLRQRLYNYRTKLSWPVTDVHRRQFINIFELLVDFANYRPEYYDTVRSELASWILHTSDPELSQAAEKEFARLYRKYESRLTESSPEFSDEHWDSLLVFGEELIEEEKRRIKEILIGTTFLKQSIILAFDDRLFEIDQIQPGGIWISRIVSRRKYLRYRVSINTRTGKHYDLQVIISEDVNDPEVLKTIYWLMTISNYPYGHRILPRLGCCRPELGARSLVYKGDLTVWERIRELSSLRLNIASSPRSWALKKLIVRSLAVIFRGWILSGRRIIPGAIAPENVMAPDQDFMEDSIIQSLSGWQYYESKISLIEPMIKNFIQKTAAHYPWSRDMLNEEWIFDACVEEMGPEEASIFLSELREEVDDVSDSDSIKNIISIIDEYIESLNNKYYVPIRVQNAISRYENWAEINSDAIPKAKQQLVDELLRLYRFDRLSEIARYHLYRYTYFKDSGQEVMDAFDNLLYRMFKNPTLPAIKMIELTSLHEAIIDTEDRKVFGSLIFPSANKPHQMDLLTVGDSEHKQVIMQTSVTDKLGETHTFREPIEPSEIGQLYRLFFKEGYSKTVNESDRFLVVIDSYGQIIGGLCYRFEGDDVVLLDGSVVAAPFMGRGIGSALVEDFCNRMGNQNIRIVKTHFFLRKFYLRRGFKVDQRWGALVRFLKSRDYEK
jgi:GNAT superfamily N-acetyltransferase